MKIIGAFLNYANAPKYVRNADANEKVVIMTMIRKVESMANKHIVFTFHYQLMHFLIKTLSQFTFKTTHVKMSVMRI